jgi:hypothetical protein
MEDVCASHDLANLYEFSAADFSIMVGHSQNGLIRTMSLDYGKFRQTQIFVAH